MVLVFLFSVGTHTTSPSSVSLEWKYNSPTNNSKQQKFETQNTKNTTKNIRPAAEKPG
jgi:hypothetical protein